MTPKVLLENWYFFPEFYQKKFWQEVIPAANPLAEQVFTPVYEDSYSPEIMLTISSPIIINGHFIGALSTDIKLDYMAFLLELEETVGVSFLVNENKQLITTNEAIAFMDSIPKLTNQTTWSSLDGGELYSAPLIDEQLYMLHYINDQDVQLQAISASLVIWLMLFVVLILSFFSVFAFNVKLKNSALMIIDPLTKLYNRHGFFTILKPIYSGLLRSPVEFALIMVDIDDLQGFNDQYGHLAGD